MATKKGGKAQVEQQHSHAESIDKMVEQLNGEELEQIYAWVDEIPFSRPKRNIARDFSDGVLIAEMLWHIFPHDGLVELHNYTPSCSTNKKKENWFYLNRKVFTKLNFELAEDVINDLVCCKAGMIEKVLLMLRVKINRAEHYRKQNNDKPEADQYQHQHAMSPGRKDQKTIKVGMDSTKGKFGKTKQAPESKQHVKTTIGITQKRRTGPVAETDLVSRLEVEEKEQDILARDETINIMQAKISRLEHLLHLKDMRIDDLQNRVESTRPTGIRR